MFNISHNGDLSIRGWEEDGYMVGVYMGDRLYLDTLASVDDLTPDININEVRVQYVDGLSNIRAIHIHDILNKMSPSDTVCTYILAEHAYVFKTYEEGGKLYEIITSLSDDIVAIVFGDDTNMICVVTDESIINVVKLLSKQIHLKIHVVEELPLVLENNIEQITNFCNEIEEHMEHSPLHEMFSGQNLHILATEFGGNSKFTRKKRTNHFKQRLTDILTALENSPVNTHVVSQHGVYLKVDSEVNISTSLAITTINKFLPEDMHVSSNSHITTVMETIKLIIPCLDYIKTYKYE